MVRHRLLQLAPLPNYTCARMSLTAQITDDRIAYIPTLTRKGVVVYDVQIDEWKPYSQEVTNAFNLYDQKRYITYGNAEPCNIAFDSSTKMLYWSSVRHIAGLHTVTDRVWRPKRWKPLPSFVDRGTMLCINGAIHFLGELHDVVSTKSWKRIYRESLRPMLPYFPHIGTYPIANCKPTATYIPSKNVILLIGCGHKQWINNGLNLVKHWQSRIGSLNDEGKCEWRVLRNHSGDFPRMNAVVTKDSRYVILSPVKVSDYFGGSPFEPPENWRYIHILDIEDNYKWRRTEIEMPLPNWDIFTGYDAQHWREGRQLMFRTGNDHKKNLTVHGFVRRLYRQRTFQNIPAMPVVLIALIQTYHSQELIHWANDDIHVAIPLCDILSSPSVDVEW